MNSEKLEAKIQSLVTNVDEETFIYDLLLAYKQPKASITRLKKGDYNLSKIPGEILWKKKLFFKKESDCDLHSLIDELKSDPVITKQHPRFIIVTDFQTLLSVDTKTEDTLDVPILKLAKHYDFFLPWAGMEKFQLQSETLADIKAAERMGRLYDLILEDNPAENEGDRHALNIFLSRLLFCYFAEDTGIFADDQFTKAVASHTAQDGSDLQVYLQKLFQVLNLEERSSYPQFLQDFPYVNGGLFGVSPTRLPADEYPVPAFTAKSRKIIIECGALNWKEINPDIFGSMIQAVIHNDQRGSMGMHYTSVLNIMKVIGPLFLNDLYSEFKEAGNNRKKLKKLLDRLYHLRLFDPACGSGNFLIIAYKELCRLEIEIFQQLHGKQLSFRFTSNIRLSQFYGIELDDFAHETAKLSLWLAEHQMNLAFKEVFGEARPTLPLQDSGHIVCGNATQLVWEEVCPKDEEHEIYILGNPPYLGFQNQNEAQKNEIISVFSGFKKFKRIDYIGCWFKKATDYIKNTYCSFAFVSTNSICQGEQVRLIWPYIFSKGMEIFFAHQSFSWGNNAKNKAKVTCVIVGLKDSRQIKFRYLYTGDAQNIAKNISPYLIDASTVIVEPRSKPMSNISKMSIGNVPLDGNNFILNKEEKDEFLNDCPEAGKFIRRYMGAADFMRGNSRYCIWVTDESKCEAVKIPSIAKRIEKCRTFRSNGGVVARQHVHVSHRFRTQPHQETQSIIFPKTTSSRRKYVPAGFLGNDTIISEKALASYGAEPYMFSILSSLMHMIWLSITSSRMRNDYQYSVQLTYNTFPFPNISEEQKSILEEHVFNVLDEREQHPEKNMAQLYDPDKMPDDLRQAHHEMDLAVEKCYRSRPFKSDEERLEYLFRLYEEMIEKERQQ